MKKLAVKTGLKTHEMRQYVWPLFLQVDVLNIPDYKSIRSVLLKVSEDIKEHKYTDQVAKDIDRSLWKFTKGKADERTELRKELSAIINAILSRNSELHYYQGFHDITSIFLMILGERQAFLVMERIANFHIRFG